ncbi:Tau class glutathione S-transferase [Dorcoceras hygrometricum]|uniref:Tau class glutathione S-transferase n=1 Tax=Dorcoceras hygrometricum TaxID=472368 RepID=A0A2Z7BAI9_9LAMI|nr:Tau class glutathione S-transferase [Dorcoceras hygrometricum]
MTNQIKRRNVSCLTYENFPGGHSYQYCSHPCTLNSTNPPKKYRKCFLEDSLALIPICRIKRLPLGQKVITVSQGITDSACKNQLVVVSVHYGPFNPYIPIRSTTIGKSRVAKDPIAMRTSWRSNSDIASVTRVSMTFRVVRINQYNQELGLIHSTNGNHLESPNEGSSIDHQVTIYLHAQNITMFPTNETWFFASQILVSSSGGLILILTAQSTRN